jgi:type IV secretory pathway TraG/TraD family ATPase VirD4
MARKTASAFEGFETFTNSFKMIFKMHLCILAGCLLLQCFILYALWDFRSYDNRFMLAWYKARIAAQIPLQMKVAFPTPDGGRNVFLARDIVQSPDLINYASQNNYRYLVAIAWSFCTYLFYPLTLFYFRRKAVALAEKAHLRGTRLIDPKHYRTLVRKRKDVLDLPMGSVQLPLEAETKHLVLVGKSGCGKTNAVNQIIARLRERGDRALIYDSKGDFIAKFYDPVRDLIFNPLDRRSLRWTLFNDIRIRPDIDAIAGSQIPPPNDHENPFWRTTARGLFAACLRFLRGQGHTTNRDIWELLISEDAVIAECLNQSREMAAKYLSRPDSDTAKSIISTLTSHLGAYEYLATVDGEFSITDWVKAGEGFLFISSYADIRHALKPLISLFIDQLSMRFLALPECPAQKTFFILEELWTLQKLPALLDLVTQSRSKCGALVLSVQEIAQLEAIYGRSGARTIFNNCGSQLVFGCTESETARYCSQLLGEEEVLEATRSYTLGVDKFKDGVNITQARSKKDVLLPSEFRALPDLSAILKINNYPPLRTRFEYRPFEIRHSSFEPSETLAFAAPGTPDHLESEDIDFVDEEIGTDFHETDENTAV